jgi:hypothetical protein
MTIPAELNTPEWQALAVRLGHASIADMLRDIDAIELRPRSLGWSCEWVRYYDGVRSDTRLIVGCHDLAEVARRIGEVEDDGDREDVEEAARG